MQTVTEGVQSIELAPLLLPNQRQQARLPALYQ